MGETVTVTVKDGKFSGYLAKPASGQGPGVLVIQEIFGVNKGMREICDRYAAAGYIALCSDIFWRQEPGVDITDQTQEEWNKAFALYKGFDEAKGVDDLIASLAYLRKVPGCNGKVGVTGYCLGGKLTYLMACRSDCDAAVGYYGVGIDAALNEAAAIKHPTILHFAEKDGFVPLDTQNKVKTGLKGNKHVTVYSYPDVDHGFCRPGGQHFDAAACKAANERTMELFKKALS